MTPQILYLKKNPAVRRCERFFAERRIPVQTRDLQRSPLSPGELDTLATACGGHDALVDRESKAFTSRGMGWMDFDPREELLDHPELLRLPIVRTDAGVQIDPQEDALRELV